MISDTQLLFPFFHPFVPLCLRAFVPCLHQFIVELRHRLRNDANVGDYGHEIGVAGPAWDQVLVEVAGDACAGGAAEVGADVEALGAHGVFEEADDGGGLGAEVAELFGGEFFEVGLMGARGDEQVAVGVGVAVDENYAVRGMPEDEARAAFFGGGGLGGFAEEAGAGVAFVDRTDVVHPPGGVEGVAGHCGSQVELVAGSGTLWVAFSFAASSGETRVASLGFLGFRVRGSGFRGGGGAQAGWVIVVGGAHPTLAAAPGATAGPSISCSFFARGRELGAPL